MWGNRGSLLNAEGQVTRPSRGRGWVVCVLKFKGRHRAQWQPGRLTELYFLDEATALAAGHRPCGECRVAAYRRFQAAWGTAHPGTSTRAPAMDEVLHADRLADRSTHRRYQADARALPDGVMVRVEEREWLVRGDELLAWSPAGYGERRPRPDADVTVLTPRCTVATIAAGYAPDLHPSARCTPTPDVRDPARGRLPGVGFGTADRARRLGLELIDGHNHLQQPVADRPAVELYGVEADALD